jgi:hypothetical protein
MEFELDIAASFIKLISFFMSDVMVRLYAMNLNTSTQA